MAKPTSSLPSEPPPPARSTGSQTNGASGSRSISSSTVSTISTEPSMPSLTAETGMSLMTLLACAMTHSRSRTRKSLTSTVSCTVRAVTVGGGVAALRDQRFNVCLQASATARIVAGKAQNDGLERVGLGHGKVFRMLTGG